MSLASLIRNAILAAFDAGTIDREHVSQIVVGPSGDMQTLCLWSSNVWENYNEYYSSEPVAELSNAAWLDEIDELGKSVPSVREPTGYRTELGELDLGERQEAYVAARKRLRVRIQDALREVATDGSLGELRKVVGLMEKGVSVSNYADLVAFVHPHGALPIWPIHEQRAGDIDIYAFGVLHDEGVTMFYPEGEGDSLDDDELAPAWRTYAFADMESWRTEGRREDIYFRMRGDLHDIRFTSGHYHDEWGGPDGDEIQDALGQHFERHPELTFNPNRMPRPDDSDAFERWVATYTQQNTSAGRTVVGNAYDDFGEAAARLFLERQAPEAEDRGYSIAALADRLLADHEIEKALELIVQLDGKPRLYEWREELRALLLLGRYSDALHRGEAIAAADDSKRAGDVLPWQVIALAGLGRDQEAAELLDSVEQEDRDEETWFAEAFLYRHSNSERARAALARSLGRSANMADLGRLFLEDSPDLIAVLDRRAHLERQREAHNARIAELIERVTPESRPLDILGAATAGLTSGPGGEPEQWRLVAKLERGRDQEGSYKRLVRAGRAEGITWVPSKLGGMTGIDLTDTSQPKLVAEIACATSLEDGCCVGNWMFAADYGVGLTIIDLGTREIVAQTTRFFDDSLSGIAAGDGFVALVGNHGAELYDIGNPRDPELLSVVGSGDSFCEGVVIRGDTLFMAAGRGGLVVADVSDRRNPVIVAALARDDPDWYANAIDLYGDVAVLARGKETWFVDVAEPARPRSLYVLGDEERQPRLQAFTSDTAGHRLIACDEDVPVMWTLDLDDAGYPSRVVAHPTVGLEGEPERFFYYSDAELMPDDRLAVINDDGLLVFERQSGAAPHDVTAPMRAAEQPLRAWVRERLQQHASERAGEPIGVVVLSLVFKELELGIEPPRTIAGVEAGPIRDEREPELYEADLGDLVELPPEDDQDDSDDPLGLLEKRRANAWLDTIDAVLRSLRDDPLLRDQAAGRVYLVRRGYDPRRDRSEMRVIDRIEDSSKPWQPYRRAVVDRGPPTLADKLEDHATSGIVERAARDDEALRAELFELAAGGHAAALRAASGLRDLDSEAVLAAYLAAADTGGLSRQVINGLAHYADREPVRALLERIFDHPPQLESYSAPGPTQLRLAAAAALEIMEDDRVLDIVRGLLDDPEGDHRHADLAIEAMQAMPAGPHRLLMSLRGWVERADEHDNRLPGMCRQLFRAGHRELPDELRAQSAREKTGEQYATIKLGIKGLDDDIPQAEACAAERLFTSHMLLERVGALRQADDRDASVWPPELPLEPWPGSWRFVLEPALPMLETSGELDGFVELLRAHASPDERYAADRALLLGMADYYENTQRWPEWRRIAEAILETPDAFEDAPLRDMRRRVRLLRLQDGWDLLNAGDVAEARAVAEQAIADEPDNAEALYFDARVVWIEQSSPEASIERAKKHLERLGHDPSGRGRLLNLIGCSFDELGRTEDALPYFERAAQAHPEEPMYLANIAECHEKLGHMDLALQWARTALERGATSELCQRIVRESESA